MMTTIKYDKAHHQMLITGHAGSAPAGEDLVCAACTILSYTLINAASSEVDYNASFYMNDLDAVIRVQCEPKAEVRERCEYMFDVILTGFLTLSDKYPEYVKVIGGHL